MVNRKHYPDWPGLDPGFKIVQRGELAGKGHRGYGRQSSTQDGEEPSTDDQEIEFWEAVDDLDGDADASMWRADPNAPASVGAKPRPSFEKLMTEIRANQLRPEADRPVSVWFWHSSRQSRGDINIYDYAETFADAGMLININGRVLNPRNPGDLEILAKMHIEDRAGAANIALNTTKNMAKALRRGKPPQKPAYGLLRDYKKVGGKKKIFRDVANWDGSELDPQWPDWDAGAGGGRSTAPARVVQLIFWWIEHGQEIGEIVQRLNEREIRPPGKAAQWIRQRVTAMAGNPLYKGFRYSKPKDASRAARLAAVVPLKEGTELGYDVLIEPEQFDAVQERLARHDLTRRITSDEPGGEAPGFHQSTKVTRCDHCGAKLVAGRARSREGVFKVRCPDGHTYAMEDQVDDAIGARVALWSCRADVREHLRDARERGSGAAATARERARDLRQTAAALQTDIDQATDARTIVTLTNRQTSLENDADKVEAEGWQESLSTGLAALLTAGEKGADAATDHWVNLPVSARKAIIGEIADFRLARSEPGRKNYYGADGARMLDPRRLRQTWKLGPPAGMPAGAGPAEAEPSRRELAQEAIRAHLAASPGSTAAAIADKAGLPRPTVYPVVQQMRDTGEIIPDRPGRGCRQRPVLYTLAG